MRRFLLLLTTALCCADRGWTEVVLYQKVATSSGTSLVALGQTLNLGSVAAGDRFDIQLRMLNTGPQSVALSPIYATTDDNLQAFSVEYQQSIFEGDRLAPGSNVDFVVRFAPIDPGSYRGTLFYFGKDRQVALSGISPEGVTLTVQGNPKPLTTADIVDFGAVQRKLEVVKQFTLANYTARALEVKTLAVTGSGYSMDGLVAPAGLVSGQTRTFTVRFAPTKSGILRGSLIVDGRVFGLEGFATEPPYPAISFVVPAGRSGQQVAVKIKLSEASRAVGSVVVTLAGLEQDSSVALLPVGGRTATLALREGDTELTQLLQTGTTAGTLKVTAELVTQKINADLVLAPVAPVLSSVTVNRVAGRIELRVTGFDNTRGMQDAAFAFQDKAGVAIGGAIHASLAEAFGKYFAGATPGGTFSMNASFPVQGDITQVGSVGVELTNGQGSAHSANTPF